MILQSEISNEGMVLIMEKLHTYVPTVSTPIELECPKSDEPTTMIKDDFHYILKGRDQLTVARARSSKRVRSNSLHPLDKLEGLIPVCEDWHAKGCLISGSLHAHVTILELTAGLFLLYRPCGSNITILHQEGMAVHYINCGTLSIGVMLSKSQWIILMVAKISLFL